MAKKKKKSSKKGSKKAAKKPAKKEAAEPAGLPEGFSTQVATILVVILAILMMVGAFGTGGAVPVQLFDWARWLVGLFAFLVPPILIVAAIRRHRSEAERSAALLRFRRPQRQRQGAGRPRSTRRDPRRNPSRRRSAP